MKEMKIDDVKVEKEKKAQEPAAHEKAAQIEKEAVRALSVDEVEEALTKSTYRGEEKPTDDIIVVPDGTPYDIIETLAEQRRYIKELGDNKEILKERLARSIEEREKADRTVAEQMKTISKMQQAHEAEVADLKDRLMEKEAECNAAKKRKDEIIKERTECANALDDDSVAFEAILDLAHIAQSVSQSLYKVSKRIEAETEGRI